MPSPAKKIVIEDCEITLLNFKGKEMMYNPEGYRNFCVFVSEDEVDNLIADGWNVRTLKPQEEGDDPRPILQVAVRFDVRPPRVILITEDGIRTQLDEKTVEVLDFANIKTVDLIAVQHPWTFGNRSGYKAYLQTMFVTIEEDELEKKYKIHENPPESASEEPF